jgi:hypothetical protein
MMISRVVHYYPFIRNQPLKSAGDQHIRIFRKKLIKLKKNIGNCDWVMEYAVLYSNAVADSVMLYLQHDFYTIIFKIKHKVYTARGAAPPPPPQGKILGAHLCPHGVFMCFVWISEQTAIISLYTIN